MFDDHEWNTEYLFDSVVCFLPHAASYSYTLRCEPDSQWFRVTCLPGYDINIKQPNEMTLITRLEIDENEGDHVFLPYDPIAVNCTNSV